MYKDYSKILVSTSNLKGLERFTIFNTYDSFKLLNTFKLKDFRGLKVMIIETFNYFPIHSSGKSMDTKITSNYIFGSFLLNWDTEGIYLSPEKFTDKILDFFIDQDIDFDSQKKFNEKFRLLANNVELIKSNLPEDFITYVSELGYLQLEVINQRVVFSISPSYASKFILKETLEVGKNLIKLLNK